MRITHKTHELAQLLLMFSNSHVFQETNETWVLVFTMKLLEYKSSMSSLLEGLVHISRLQ
ncbi:hypothetical protein Hanom_Chr15g01370341 [Helianthus anomalus]